MSKHGDVVDRVQCPKCNDSGMDNLVIYEDGYKKCFSCDYYSYDNKGDYVKKEKKIVPLLESVKYQALKARGITKEICQHFRYGVAVDFNNPVHVAKFGNAQKIRTKDKKFYWKGIKPCQFFGQELYDHGKNLVITEGEIDCLSVAQTLGKNWPVVSLPDGSKSARRTMEENIEWLNGFDNVILMFDNDEAGRDAVKSVVDLMPDRIKVAQLPDGFKDANELLLANRGNDIKDAFWNSKKVSAELSGVKGVDDYSYDDFIEAVPKGDDFPFPGLTEALGGMRPEINLYAAGSGCGKSTILKQISEYSMTRYGRKWGTLFLEEQDKKTLQSYIALKRNIKLTDLRENPTMISREDFMEDVEHFKDKLYIATNTAELAYNEIISKIEYMIKAMKVDHVILDHISMAVAGVTEIDERKAIDMLMKDLYKLTVRTGVGIHAVVHLKNLEGDKDWTDGVIPKKNHLRGSGGLAQMAYNVITYSRDVNSDDEDERLSTYVHAQKIRENGEYTGRCTDHLRFNTKTGKLDSIEAFPKCPHGRKKKPQQRNDNPFTPQG